MDHKIPNKQLSGKKLPTQKKKCQWFPSKEDKAQTDENKIMETVKAKYVTKFIECGKDKSGKPLLMNTLLFDAATGKKEKESNGDNAMPIVLAHGYGAGVGFFFRNYDTLASIPGTRLIAIDWLGMGRSSRCPFPKSAIVDKMLVEENNLEKSGAGTDKKKNKYSGKAPSKDETAAVHEGENFFLDAFEIWRQKLGLEKFILIGHSLGGYLASAYALSRPELIQRLILLSPVGVPPMPPNFQENFAEKAKENWKLRTAKWLWETSTPQQLLRNAGWLGIGRWLTSKVIGTRFQHLNLGKDEIAAISGYLHSISILPRSGEDSLNTILKFGAWARLPLAPRFKAQLKVPTAFIYGEIDWMDPVPARFLKDDAKIGHLISNVYVIPDGGHHMYLENPMGTNPVLQKEIRLGLVEVGNATVDAADKSTTPTTTESKQNK